MLAEIHSFSQKVTQIKTVEEPTNFNGDVRQTSQAASGKATKSILHNKTPAPDKGQDGCGLWCGLLFTCS